MVVGAVRRFELIKPAKQQFAYTIDEDGDVLVENPEVEAHAAAEAEEQHLPPNNLPAETPLPEVAFTEELRTLTARPKYGVNGTVGPAHPFTWAKHVRCKDGTYIPSTKKPNAVEVATAMNNLRVEVARYYGVDVARIVIAVNSWYRTKKHNMAVGGGTYSRHMEGDAMDVMVYVRNKNGSLSQVPPSRVATLAENRIKFREGGIGRYYTFTHLDTRGYRARWSG